MKKLKKHFPKWLNSELFFYIGAALLPFENFFFAPSKGWATLSPLLFAVYLVLNFKLISRFVVRYYKIFIFFIVAIILGSITGFIYNVNYSDYFGSFIPLFLGATCLLSFSIFYSKTKRLDKIISVLVVSYSICLVLGLFEFLSVKLGNYTFSNMIKALSARDYIGLGRVQFWFTEPSFVGMHLFGVLLPLYFLSRRKNLLFILTAFAASAIAFQSGVRVTIDILIVLILFSLFLILRHNKAKFIPLILLILGLGFSFAYNSNYRIQQIVNQGVYADGSLASRYFRVESSVIGYKNTFPALFAGFGLGNSIYPMRSGYDEAAEHYDNEYIKEVEEIGSLNASGDSISYSLYTRFISEFGLIMTIIAIIYLVSITDRSTFPQKWLYFSIVLYLYLQFESLGFYAIWLFIIVMLNTRGDLSFFERRKLKRHLENAEKDRPRRVLVFGITDKSGGVESVIMNYYRNIDREKLQFDFLCNTEKVAYEDEIKSLGGKIYKIPARSKNLASYYKNLKAFFKEHAKDYDIFWMNVCSLANIDYLKFAKRYGISRRIIHSHNSKNMDSEIRGLIHKINRINIDDYATDFWTCSDTSADWFYIDIDKTKIKKVKNAFDLEKFEYSKKSREAFRKSYNLKDEKVILNVGRLTFQKNQEFILEIVPELMKKVKNVKVLLAGTGEDKEKLESLIKNKGLEKTVELTGEIGNVPEALSGADIFLFPSKFEGSPVALYEAEASAIPTVASKESYTEDRKLSDSITFLTLKTPSSKWADTIALKLRESAKKERDSKENTEYLEKSGFGIKTAAKLLEEEFLK